eukprot:SAG11_NODE_5445_length_1558_cov_1.572995_1_plen_432_part_01
MQSQLMMNRGIGNNILQFVTDTELASVVDADGLFTMHHSIWHDLDTINVLEYERWELDAYKAQGDRFIKKVIVPFQKHFYAASGLVTPVVFVALLLPACGICKVGAFVEYVVLDLRSDRSPSFWTGSKRKLEERSKKHRRFWYRSSKVLDYMLMVPSIKHFFFVCGRILLVVVACIVTLAQPCRAPMLWREKTLYTFVFLDVFAEFLQLWHSGERLGQTVHSHRVRGPSTIVKNFGKYINDPGNVVDVLGFIMVFFNLHARLGHQGEYDGHGRGSGGTCTTTADYYLAVAAFVWTIRLLAVLSTEPSVGPLIKTVYAICHFEHGDIFRYLVIIFVVIVAFFFAIALMLERNSWSRTNPFLEIFIYTTVSLLGGDPGDLVDDVSLAPGGMSGNFFSQEEDAFLEIIQYWFAALVIFFMLIAGLVFENLLIAMM